MNRPKGQHFVPRFYLTNFVDGDGFVWTYDPVSGATHKGTPENTAKETNFYSILDENGVFIDEIESWLSSIETKASDIYPKVLRGEVLKGQQRADFALFVASLFARSPAQIDLAARTVGAFAQLHSDFIVKDRPQFEKFMDQMDQDTATTTTAEQRDHLFDFARDKSKYTMVVSRKAGLMSLGSSEKLAEVIVRMKWITVKCADQHLVTSDSPVVRVTPREYHDRHYGDGGFLNKHTFVSLPLSPSILLECYWGDVERMGVQPVKKERGKLYNKQRAGFAHKYLYSSRQDAGIMALGKRHIGPAMRIDFGRELAPIEVKRKI